MAVRDHGPGLPTEDPGALSDRFWRAEGGRERGRSPRAPDHGMVEHAAQSLVARRYHHAAGP